MPLRKQFFILGSLLYVTCRSAVCLSQMPGGYYPTTITKDVQQAAAFAVRQQSKNEPAALKLIAIPKAEMQIVAGRNYRLVLKVKRGKKSGDAAVVVFEALPSRDKVHSTGVSTLSSSDYTLTSWQWISLRQPTRKR